MRIDMTAIYTDENGVPFERPEPRALDEDVGIYLQRMYAYRDKITDCANRGFDAAFRKTVR